MVSTQHDSSKKDVSKRHQQLIKELRHKIHEILKKSDMKQEIKNFELSKEEIIRIDINIEILTTDIDELQQQKPIIFEGEENAFRCPQGMILCTPENSTEIICCPK